MADLLFITIMTQARLRSPGGLGRLLDAFESQSRLSPTHWGPDDRARNPYDRDELIREVSGLAGDLLVPGIHRRKPPRFEAYFSARDAGLNPVRAEFRAGLRDEDLHLAFSLGDALAGSLAAEFGTVHPIWDHGDRSQRYSASDSFKPDDFPRCGPRALCARTWLGPHLKRLLGTERLRASGCTVKDTPWGGLQVDLAERPWEAGYETLSARQALVMAELGSSGVFGDYSQRRRCKPGPGWVPISLDGAP